MDKKSVLSSKINQVVLGYINEIKKDGYPIEKAIVFGSYARGNPKPWSDLDLCLVSPKFGKDSIEEMKYLGLKSLTTVPRIEAIPYSPIDFQNLPDPLLLEIKQQGTQIL